MQLHESYRALGTAPEQAYDSFAHSVDGKILAVALWEVNEGGNSGWNDRNYVLHLKEETRPRLQARNAAIRARPAGEVIRVVSVTKAKDGVKDRRTDPNKNIPWFDRGVKCVFADDEHIVLEMVYLDKRPITNKG